MNETTLFRVTFISEVNIVTRESHLDLEAEDAEGAQEAAIDFLEARAIKVPSIRSIRELI